MSSNGNKNVINPQQQRYQNYYGNASNQGGIQTSNPTANPNGYQIHHVQQIPMSVMAAATAATTQTLKGPHSQSTDYHVQQCLVQGPPPPHSQHPLHTSPHPPFRIVHQRDGGYQVGTPNPSGYPNPSGPQQTQIRGMQPNAPQTPPQGDMKISGGQQQMPVHSYGRNTNQNMYRPNQNQQQRNMPRQQMMTSQPFMPMQPMPLPYASPQYTLTQRQTPQPQIYSPNQYNIMAAPYNFYQVQPIQHTRPLSTPNTINNTPPQGIGLPPVLSAPISNQPRKRRPNAVKIEDPVSGKDVLEEVFGEEPSSQTAAIVPSHHQSGGGGDISDFDHHDINNTTIQTTTIPDSGMLYNIEVPQQIASNTSLPINTHSRAIPIQDALSETPVVSAQQDGPSIEIIPKLSQNVKKPRKQVVEQSAPPPPLPVSSTTVPVSQSAAQQSQQPPTHVKRKTSGGGIDKCITASLSIYKDTIANPNPNEPIMYPSPQIIQTLEHEKKTKEAEVAAAAAAAAANAAAIQTPQIAKPSAIVSTPPQQQQVVVAATKVAQQQQSKPVVQHNKSVTASIAIYNDTINDPKPNEKVLHPSPAVIQTLIAEKKEAEIERETRRLSETDKIVEAQIKIIESNKSDNVIDTVNDCIVDNTTNSDYINNNIIVADNIDTKPTTITPQIQQISTNTQMTSLEPQKTYFQPVNSNDNKNEIPDNLNNNNNNSIAKINNINTEIKQSVLNNNNETIETNADLVETNDVLNNVKVPAVAVPSASLDAAAIDQVGSDNLCQTESSPNNDDVDINSMADAITTTTTTTPAAAIDEKIALVKKDLIEYEEGQWSPNNLDGKKVYSLEQLRKLKDSSVCLTKPDVKEHEVVLREVRTSNARNDASGGGFQYQKFVGSGGGNGGGGGGGNMDSIFLPNFARTSSQRGGGQYAGKRISQTGSNKQQSGGKASSRTGMIHVSLSLREDVKLNETENAWKPTVLLDSNAALTKEERSEQDLFKRVRGILNKLTPEKFVTLIAQMKQLTIDTNKKLSGVIELIFEKAVDEPNFSIAYAHMCSNLSSISINAGSQNQLIFQKILLHHCQSQFEDIGSDKHTEFRKKLEECKDPEKRLEMEEEERKMRRRSVGTTRFVGELFKFEMLTFNIMLKCLNQMLVKKNEESLECLCKLLTTIGKNLTVVIERDEKVNDKQQLQKIFDEMESLTTNKQFKISSRVRFMLQDVIDLKRSNWNPRRQDLNPKKMGEIIKEAETEQLNIQLMNYPTAGPTRGKDERRPGGGNVGGGGGGNQQNTGSNSMNYMSGRSVSEDGWSTQTSKNNRSSISNIDPKKLQTPKLNITNNMALGSASYYKWNQRQPQIETPITNKFSALLDSKKSRPLGGGGGGGGGGSNNMGGSGGRNKESYHSHDSMERYDRGSQGRTHESSSYSRNSQTRDQYSDSPIMRAPNKLSSSSTLTSTTHHPDLALSTPTNILSSNNNSGNFTANRPPSNVDLDKIPLNEPPENILKMITNSFDIYEEYCNNISSIEDCEVEIQRIPQEYRWCIAREIYIRVLEHKRKHRIKVSEIFVLAIRKGQLIKLNHFLHGLQKYLELTEDFSIDYPKIWSYVAEMLRPLLWHKIINLKDLVNVAAAPIAANLGGPLLTNLFEELLGECGPKFIKNLWIASDVQWSDFIKSGDITAFIAANKLQYVTSNDQPPPQPKQLLDMTEFQEKLITLVTLQTPYDEIIEWISVNVDVKGDNFIRTLTTAILRVSIEKTNTSYKLNSPVFEGQLQLLRRYIDNNDKNELQCLFAIQRLINVLEHPAGVLRTIVEKLYEEDIISIEGFTNWKVSTDPNEQEGKGVAQSSLVSFFTSLNEQVSSDDNIDESDNKDSKN